MQLTSFKALGLSASTLAALEKKGFTAPTATQAAIIPKLLNEDNDLIGQAQTGTGKTAAFALPLIELLQETNRHVQAIILTPTRELAQQVATEIISLRGSKSLKVLTVYGGQSMQEQLRGLKQGVAIVVGTPGRVIDHLTRKSLNLSRISHLILDEGDEMLKMGFIDDIEAIFEASHPDARKLLFSATMPKALMSVAERYMHNQIVVRIANETLTSHLTEQIYYEIKLHDKFTALCRIIDAAEQFYAIIFCRTKVDVESVTQQLLERGYLAAGLHGDISQANREKILKKFRAQQVIILVATDVAARGIDVNNLTHVVNYALPSDPETYVHRIGRTGRAGQTGIALTFITPSEFSKLAFIKKITKINLQRGTLPSIQDIIKIKTQQLLEKLDNIVDTENYKEYETLANKLLKKHDANIMLAALLKHHLQNKFSLDQYAPLEENFQRGGDKEKDKNRFSKKFDGSSKKFSNTRSYSRSGQVRDFGKKNNKKVKERV